MVAGNSTQVAAHCTASKRLLVMVDDDHDLRLSPIQALCAEYFPELTFLGLTNVSAAVDFISAHSSELALLSLDYDLGDNPFRGGVRIRPTQTGMDIVRLLQVRRPEFPVVVHSASREAELMVSGLRDSGYMVERPPHLLPDGSTSFPAAWLLAAQKLIGKKRG